MLRYVSLDGKPMPEPPRPIFMTVIDQAEDDEGHPHRDAFLQNSWWLIEHWLEVLPPALGKYLAVAGRQAFAADSAEEARALARAAHPEDAVKLLRTATAGLPNDPDIKYHLATALSKTNQAAEAKTVLQEVMRSNTAFDSKPDAQRLLNSLGPN